MKKLLAYIFLLFAVFFINTPIALAIENPLAASNNIFGVHILFTGEIEEAARLVNTSGGDWGYVTIPIQTGDRDLEKWQKFMDKTREIHVIPILRLATEGDYFNTKVWRKPSYYDIVDFANFLNSLSWPTRNRYVVIFNEVNRDDEWGGQANPQEYAQLLSYAATTFKSRSEDFFVISAGLDNASINGSGAINQFNFLNQMNAAVPGIFYLIDGISSHSYPNPGFSQSPLRDNALSISSFKYERSYINQFSNKNLPTFITETGWSKSALPENTISSYFTQAFSSVWNDKEIVTVTPFLLNASAGPFTQFSLINTDGTTTDIYKTIKDIQKAKGNPSIATQSAVLGEKLSKGSSLPMRDFSENRNLPLPTISMPTPVKILLKWIMKID